MPETNVSRQKRLIALRPLPEYGELITLKDFRESVKCNAFTDNDGHGYLATDCVMSDIQIWPSTFEEECTGHTEFTHIMWFNK